MRLLEEPRHAREAESNTSTSQACFAADLAAAGRIAVQIVQRQRLNADPDDAAFWQKQAGSTFASIL